MPRQLELWFVRNSNQIKLKNVQKFLKKFKKFKIFFAVELELRIHNPDLLVAAGTGQVFWKGPDDESFGEDRCVSFRVPNDGEVHVHRVSLQGHPKFGGRVQWLRIDPADVRRLP